MKTVPFALTQLFALLSFLGAASWSSCEAQTVDVFFIAGQSNAGNIGEQNGIGSTNVGFNLTFARIADRPSAGNTAPGTVVEPYSSNFLNLNDNVNQLAVAVHAENDLAIYAFGRNGRPLANQSNDDGESWNPDAGELYDAFIAWANQRLSELQDDGLVPQVRGVLWFQGEGDVRDANNGTDPNAVANYQSNFENLVASFREDFTAFGGDDLVVIATDLRIVSNSAVENLNQQVRNATANVAAADPLVGTIETTDDNGNALGNRFGGAGGFNTDVHFSNGSQQIIVNRFADEFNRLIAENTPLLLGDVNRDGVIDLLDISPFVELILTGQGFIDEADVNQDGVIDLVDVAPFIELVLNPT